MNMPAENITIINIITFGFVMSKNKSIRLHSLFKTIYRCCRIPIPIQYIVIADNQFYGKMFKIISPSCKHVDLFIGMTVKQITNDDKISWFKKLDLCRQPLQVFFKNSLWYGDAILSKMAGLAKVKVRKDQRLFFFPENAALS